MSLADARAFDLRAGPGLVPGEVRIDVGPATPAGQVTVAFGGVTATVDGDRLVVSAESAVDVVVYADDGMHARCRRTEAVVDLSPIIEGRAAHAAGVPDWRSAMAGDAERPVRHRYELDPDPPASDAPIVVVVRARADAGVAAVRVVATTDGRPPGDPALTGHVMAVPEPERNGEIEWRATLPGAPAGTWLRWRAAWRDRSGIWHAVDDAVGSFTYPRPTIPWARPSRDRFSATVAPPPPPGWLRDAVLYHLLVDRFAGPGGQPVSPSTSIGPMAFAGGTLRGAMTRLDHVADLGVTTILLSPLTPGEMHCTYDAWQLTGVDDRFGTEADARAFCAAVHDRGMRVLLDLELSYLGSQHPAARAALEDPAGPEAAWFHRSGTPLKLWGWLWGQPTFRPVDHDHEPARRALLDSLPWWLDVGFDGFRMDSAHAAPPDFWNEVGRVIRAHRPDAVSFGEVTESIAERRLLRGRLTGALDFALAHALRSFAATGLPQQSNTDDGLTGSRTVPSAATALAAAAGAATIAADPHSVSVAFAESHDDARLDLVLGHDGRRVDFAAELLTLLPGPPMLLYGFEIGLGQERAGDLDRDVRGAMPWAAADRDRYAQTAGWIRRRHQRPALRRGGFEVREVDDDGVLTFVRATANDALTVRADARQSTIEVREGG